ncbi:hypothetical protein BDZ85DRAFT_250932 [Elsinoe ampelina]|uniref:Uncharacterized protein n=1 Tax=Elsinoe ampelina TaxID=302913 RepID=A0A6A6G8S8_9PEZI|nr:hypothetical protein BDZ85DRAFT_250932 [Elsinoe ampelina]
MKSSLLILAVGGSLTQAFWHLPLPRDLSPGPQELAPLSPIRPPPGSQGTCTLITQSCTIPGHPHPYPCARTGACPKEGGPCALMDHKSHHRRLADCAIASNPEEKTPGQQTPGVWKPCTKKSTTVPWVTASSARITRTATVVVLPGVTTSSSGFRTKTKTKTRACDDDGGEGVVTVTMTVTGTPSASASASATTTSSAKGKTVTVTGSASASSAAVPKTVTVTNKGSPRKTVTVTATPKSSSWDGTVTVTATDEVAVRTSVVFVETYTVTEAATSSRSGRVVTQTETQIITCSFPQIVNFKNDANTSILLAGDSWHGAVRMHKQAYTKHNGQDTASNRQTSEQGTCIEDV